MTTELLASTSTPILSSVSAEVDTLESHALKVRCLVCHFIQCDIPFLRKMFGRHKSFFVGPLVLEF